MRTIHMLGLMLLLFAGLGAVGPAAAAPIRPAPLAAADDLTRVGYWCGPGFHLNPWGRCIPNFRRFYGPGPAFYGPRFYGRRRFYRHYSYHWHRNYRWHRNYHWHRSYHWRR